MAKIFSVLLSSFLMMALTVKAQSNSIENVQKDLPMLRSILLPGEAIAATYKIGVSAQTNEVIVFKRNGDELLGAISTSYLKKDFNRDGITDLAVVTENAPGSLSVGVSLFGERTLKIFLGREDGTFQPIAESKNAVLKGDEGGLMGDPFLGVSLNTRGSLVVEHYGGSRMRWGIKQTFQFRDVGMYLVGETRETFDSVNGDSKIIDMNFLKHVQITRTTKNEKTKIQRQKMNDLPLVSLSNLKPLRE